MSPQAAVSLADMLAEEGNVAGARDAYQRAINSRHPTASREAAIRIRLLPR